MARSKSWIEVIALGDFRNLQKGFQQANAATGGLAGSLAKAFIASRAVGEAFEFIGDSLNEADRLDDAMTRLAGQLGDLNAQKLRETADAFSDLGLSAQDVLELEAAFVDLGTSVGISQNALVGFGPEAAKAAGALALIREEDPSAILDLIAKSAGGSERAAKNLGVALIDTKDPAEQFRNIMAQLAPQIDAVTSGEKDVEQQQAKLGAQWETLQANVGGLVEGPLTDLLGFINDEIAAIPHAIEGWQMLGRAVENFGRTALAPLGNVADALRGLIGLIQSVGNAIPDLGGGGAFNERDIVQAQERYRARNGIN